MLEDIYKPTVSFKKNLVFFLVIFVSSMITGCGKDASDHRSELIESIENKFENVYHCDDIESYKIDKNEQVIYPEMSFRDKGNNKIIISHNSLKNNSKKIVFNGKSYNISKSSFLFWEKIEIFPSSYDQSDFQYFKCNNQGCRLIDPNNDHTSSVNFFATLLIGAVFGFDAGDGAAGELITKYEMRILIPDDIKAITMQVNLGNHV
ncbi:hypothetical protein DSCW_01280 [Desulfosarcina widdelii]|uniref:Lipoprotein n=1 Tax=Desulfosarcina widdelii TaxID=947919 RepID=A0A5K7YZV2_9BACT|nr:hypothetical protein [Desulfosarcina widdelii]BBO72711.1 hypothetical protein DSCW_01280 [Desulfosarcina widdelii]